MAKVNWTFQALEDLDEIAEYRAKYSEKYASFLIDAIFEQTQALEAFPYSGRVVPEINISSIRELIVQKYRIVYSVPDRSQVHILTVRPSSFPLGEISIEEEG